jgi:hypothetical protein
MAGNNVNIFISKWCEEIARRWKKLKASSMQRSARLSESWLTTTAANLGRTLAAGGGEVVS